MEGSLAVYARGMGTRTEDGGGFGSVITRWTCFEEKDEVGGRSRFGGSFGERWLADGESGMSG